MPGPARGGAARPGGGVIRFGRSSLSVRVAVGGAVFLGWDGAEPSPSYALPGPVPEPDTRALLEPDKDGGWRVVSERLLVTVSRHGAVELRTPGGELLRRDLPPRWWEAAGGQPGTGADREDGDGEDGEDAAGVGDVGGSAAQRPGPSPRPGRWMHRSQVAADARFFGLGGRTCGPRLPDGSYRLYESGRPPARDADTAPGTGTGTGEGTGGGTRNGRGRGAGQEQAPHAGRQHGVPHITMPVQLVVADAGTHLVFYDNPREGRVTLREGLEGRGSGHDRPGSSEIRVAGGPLRYWVIAGPPARVLHGWARLTGAPALPPGWALGHQHSGSLSRSGQRVREVAAQYRVRRLPLRALHVEGDGGRPVLRIFRGERGRAAGPGQETGTATGTATGTGTEEAEAEGSGTGGVHVVPAGEAQTFAFSRSGWAGMQRDGGMWRDEVATGWEGLRESISFVVGLGLCGVPYSGPGIGGSTAAPSPELYLRWFQLAAYFPLFHAHSAKGAGAREPWAFGTEVLSGCSAAMAERERLRPYFTTLAHLAHRTGAPYVRPLWWQHPRERSLRECGDAFLLGDALLVAPVLEEGARSRRVRLPFGRWYETVTGEMHEGPGEVVLDAPLSRIPVLARAGAAVPVSGTDGGIELEVWAPAPGRRGKGLVIRDADGPVKADGSGAVNGHGTGRPAPAERFTVVRRDGATVVTREDGASAGYPVRLRS